jgi:hypothetical protein
MSVAHPLGLDLLALGFSGFAVSWASSVIRLLQLTVWLGHSSNLLKYLTRPETLIVNGS